MTAHVRDVVLLEICYDIFVSVAYDYYTFFVVAVAWVQKGKQYLFNYLQ